MRMLIVPGDGDIYWQEWLGEVILRDHHIPNALGTEVTSAVGAPWVAQEWLFSIAYAWLNIHGAGFVLLGALMACAIAVLAATALRSLDLGASIVSTMVIVVVTLLTMAPSLGFRVQVISWLLTALLLSVLPHKRVRWLLVPLTVLWANVHASAMLAPVLIGAYAFGCALDKRKTETASLAILALLTFATTFLTPLGAALPVYAMTIFMNPALPFTEEWGRPPDAIVTLAIALIVAVAFAPRNRVGSGERIVTVVLFLMMLSAARNIPLFFIGAGPFAAAAFPLRSYRLVPHSRFALGLGVLVSAAAFILVVRTVHVFGAPIQALPTSAVRYITGLPEANVFCSDFAWCGLLVGHPGVRVFLDGRANPFPRQVWSEYRAIREQNGWSAALTKSGLDTVLVSSREGLAGRLSRSSGWIKSYADNDYQVYHVRRAGDPAIGTAVIPSVAGTHRQR